MIRIPAHLRTNPFLQYYFGEGAHPVCVDASSMTAATRFLAETVSRAHRNLRMADDPELHTAVRLSVAIKAMEQHGFTANFLAHPGNGRDPIAQRKAAEEINKANARIGELLRQVPVRATLSAWKREKNLTDAERLAIEHLSGFYRDTRAERSTREAEQTLAMASAALTIPDDYVYYLPRHDIRKLPQALQQQTRWIQKGQTGVLRSGLTSVALEGIAKSCSDPAFRLSLYNSMTQPAKPGLTRKMFQRIADEARSVGHRNTSEWSAAGDLVEHPRSILNFLTGTLSDLRPCMDAMDQLLSRIARHEGMPNHTEADNDWLLGRMCAIASSDSKTIERALPMEGTAIRAVREALRNTPLSVRSHRTLDRKGRLIIEFLVASPTREYRIMAHLGYFTDPGSRGFCIDGTPDLGDGREHASVHHIICRTDAQKPSGQIQLNELTVLIHELGHAVHMILLGEIDTEVAPVPSVYEAISVYFENMALRPEFLARVANPKIRECRTVAFWRKHALGSSIRESAESLRETGNAWLDLHAHIHYRKGRHHDPLAASMAIMQDMGLVHRIMSPRRIIRKANPREVSYPGMRYTYTVALMTARWLQGEQGTATGEKRFGPYDPRWRAGKHSQYDAQWREVGNLIWQGLPLSNGNQRKNARRWKEYSGMTYLQTLRVGAESMQKRLLREIALMSDRLDGLGIAP